MKTMNDISESLWELWNAPVEGSETDADLDERLQEMHRTMGRGGKSGKRLSFHTIGVVAALCAVCIFMAVRISHLNNFRDSLAGTPVTVSAGLDGPTSLVLPDGTAVVLNARSTISYNMDFGAVERIVSLEGQGFFDVTKDPEKKFVVNTPNMKITVHGTKFNVYAYPERKIDELSLVEGSVSVISGGNELKMKAGEKVLYDKISGSTHLTRTDNRMETAWLGKELNFVHAPLSNVFDVLERRFGVTIRPAAGMDMSDAYTGSFTDRNLGDIMYILKMHYGFDYTVEDSTFILE